MTAPQQKHPRLVVPYHPEIFDRFSFSRHLQRWTMKTTIVITA
jgi:hypothetical protein